MTLLEQWKQLLESQTDQTIKDFWNDYSTAETEIYTDILTNHGDGKFSGVVSEAAEQYATTNVIFTGFLDILSAEKREEITKAYKKSKTIVKEKQPGRNDPCPCGSGLKYKKCCGKNA